VQEFVERYLSSTARKVPLECILSGEDFLGRRRCFEDFKDDSIDTITILFGLAEFG
jgi:hypothetical protein